MKKEQTKNFNFSLPAELAEEFAKIGAFDGERNRLRWAIAGAAILSLLELPEDKRHEMIQRVAGARYYPESLREMIEQAKAKAAGSGQKKPKSR